MNDGERKEKFWELKQNEENWIRRELHLALLNEGGGDGVSILDSNGQVMGL